MKRSDFQAISKLRLNDCRVLLKSRQYSAAYYLTGYVIECALKACIARKIGKYEIPEKSFFQQFFTHDLEKLVSLAELKSDLTARSSKDSKFALKWAAVREWNESSRYETYSAAEARDLYKAVASRNGVLRWIKQHW